MAGYREITISCCGAGCQENRIPYWWKFDWDGEGLLGPFVDFNQLLRPEFVEGPSPTYPHQCHWEQIIGFQQEIHVYFEYGHPNQIYRQFRVVIENGGQRIEWAKNVLCPAACVNTTVPFLTTWPPGQEWGQAGEVALEPWTYADG